jgi:hypothetical protein
VLAVLAWLPIVVTALSTLVLTEDDGGGCMDICITIPLWAVLIMPASLVSAGLALAGLHRSRDARFGRYLSLSAFAAVGVTWLILVGHVFS